MVHSSRGVYSLASLREEGDQDERNTRGPVCFSEYGLRDNIQTDNGQTVYDKRTLNNIRSPGSQTTTSAAIAPEQ